MAPVKEGSRDVMGIRGIWGGVRYDRGVVMATPQLWHPCTWGAITTPLSYLHLLTYPLYQKTHSLGYRE